MARSAKKILGILGAKIHKMLVILGRIAEIVGAKRKHWVRSAEQKFNSQVENTENMAILSYHSISFMKQSKPQYHFPCDFFTFNKVVPCDHAPTFHSQTLASCC